MTCPRIAVFGDSLTEGYGLRQSQALPVVLSRMCEEKGEPARFANFGVSGNTTGDGLRRLAGVLRWKPQGVILEFGANDSFQNVPVEVARDNLSGMLDAFAKRDIRVLLVGVSCLPFVEEDYKKRWEPLFPGLAKRYALDLYPDILAPYFGRDELLLMDGTHPNAEGVRAIARDMLPQVIRLIQGVQD